MKVSVVTVSYNCAGVVNDCLSSVAGQSYPLVDHLVIDGGSTDGTMPLLQSQREQFAFLMSEPDSGIYDAMNKGICLANGDVIGFLNSDDFYENNGVLARVAELFLADSSLDACYADLIYTEELDTSRYVRYWKSTEFSFGEFSSGWCPPHPTFFVRRSVYDRLGGFDLRYRIAADVELMMRFLEVHKIRVRYVPEVWVKMRVGGTSNRSLRNMWIQNVEVLRALQSHGLPANPIRFFSHKLLSRGEQFFRRQTR